MTAHTEPMNADGTDSDAESVADESDDRDDEALDDSRPTDGDASHLDDLEDGAGCTEIWETLSERRE